MIDLLSSSSRSLVTLCRLQGGCRASSSSSSCVSEDVQPLFSDGSVVAKGLGVACEDEEVKFTSHSLAVFCFVFVDIAVSSSWPSVIWGGWSLFLKRRNERNWGSGNERREANNNKKAKRKRKKEDSQKRREKRRKRKQTCVFGVCLGQSKG